MAGVREAGPGPGRAVRHRLRLHRGRPDAGHAGAARPAGGRGVPGGPPRPAAPVRRACLPGRRPRRPGPAGPRHGRDGHRALGRPRRPAARPQRVPGARGARRPGPARAARAGPAAAELRLRAGARQRHPAAGPAARGDPAAGARGAGHHPVPRGPGLVPGHARADRDRLPVPGRAARPRPGDGVHPLRPGQRPRRPSHPGHGRCSRTPATCTRPTSSPTWTRSPPAGSTCASGATGTPGAWAGTSRAARSSTTGATRTGSCSSTTPTATCSTATAEPGWAPLSVSGLAQWGPKATAEFTGTNDPRVAVAAIKALREKGNEIDLRRAARPDQGDELLTGFARKS